jgi:hypothetical protein
LAKKDPCYGWYYKMVSSTARTRRDVAIASGNGAPCRPLIEKYLTRLAPIPPRCSKIKLSAAPALLSRELRESATRWNERGWEHWEVESSSPVSRELEKARDFYQRTLRAGCDT